MFETIMTEVHRANGRRRVRTLSESDVRAALRMRESSPANVVRAWGGFVPNSYNGSYGCRCPVLALRKDGSWSVYLGSCKRARGEGRRFTESTS